MAFYQVILLSLLYWLILLAGSMIWVRRRRRIHRPQAERVRVVSDNVIAIEYEERIPVVALTLALLGPPLLLAVIWLAG